MYACTVRAIVGEGVFRFFNTCGCDVFQLFVPKWPRNGAWYGRTVSHTHQTHAQDFSNSPNFQAEVAVPRPNMTRDHPNSNN